MHEAAVADAHAVEPGPLGLGTVLAEHADADHDEPGIEVGRPDVPSLHCPRAEVLADHVGASRQASEQLLAPGPALGILAMLRLSRAERSGAVAAAKA